MQLHYQAHAFDHNGHRAFRAFVPLTSQGKTGEMHVAMVGTWEGHPTGAFEFTPKVFDQIIARFDAQSNPMPVDYEHASMDHSPEGAPAAGWIQKLYRKGKELWATVEWTPKAATRIKEGEYRFCSPVIDFDAIDRESGEDIGVEMFNVALTNNPFLDGQHPIKLTRTGAKGPTNMEEKQLTEMVRRALSDVVVKDIVEQVAEALPKEAPAEAVIEAVAGAAQLQSAAEGAESGEAPAPAEEPAPMSDQRELQEEGEGEGTGAAQEALSILMQSSGLDEATVLDALRTNAEAIGEMLTATAGQDGTASDEEIAATAVAATDEPGTDVAQLTAEKDILLARINELTAQATETQKQAETSAADAERQQRESEVEELIAAGRALEAQRETFIAMDAKTFKAMKATAPVVVPTQLQGGSRQVSSSGDVEGEIARLSALDRNLFEMNATSMSRAAALEFVKTTRAKEAN